MARVAIFVDQPVVRAALRCLLASWGIADSVIECVSAADLPEILNRSQSDVALIELTPEITLSLIAEIQGEAPQCRILFRARSVTPELLYHLREQNVAGVICDRAPLEDFLRCLQAVLNGERSFDAALSADCASKEQMNLTPRESQLVALLAQGLKNKEIAACLGITEGTVKVYLSHLFQKLQVKDRFELALFGLRNFSNLNEALASRLDRPTNKMQPRRESLILRWNARTEAAGKPRSRRMAAGL